MRHLVLVSLVIVALLVAACGGSTPTPAPTPVPAAPAEQPTAAPAPAEPTATMAAAQPEATAAPVEAPTAAPAAEMPEATVVDGEIVLPPVNPLQVSGDIISAGSSTVFPLSEAVAELFIDEGYGGNITIDSIGTGGGFERFCVAGETDIANASRPIKEEETANCEAIGRTPLEFRVGTDALAVVVNPANDWIGDEGVTLEQLAKLFSAETTNWSDVDPAWPAQPVKRYSPGTDSGTYDYFLEAVMEDAFGDTAEETFLGAANLQLSEDDNVLVQGVSGDQYAIGYFGFAYFEENADVLRDLAIEGVSPTAETVDAGEYPLARPLFIYSDAGIMTSKPQVADFVNFYLTRVNDVVTNVGYFPASTEALNEAKATWLQAMGMAVPEEVAMMDDKAVAADLPPVNPLQVSGDIISAGSSTVFPLSEAVAELFIDEGYGGNITIDSIGTGGGFERFCVAGETDIANASRPIKEEETANCEAIGRTPLEFRVGTDALAVVVNPANDWIGDEGVTLEQLAKLFSAETTNWSDVDPAWPAQPVKRYSPGTDSGTYDYFLEAVMEDAFGDTAEETFLGAANLQLSEDDNVLVQGVSGDQYAIGYFGFAYFEENADVLRDLAIEGVSPTAETVDAGEYPLARPLFIYSDAGIMTSKPQVADFVNFYLTRVNDVVTNVGYFPASTEALNEAKATWLQAMGQ